MQYVERSTESLDWITLIIVGCIVLLAFTKVRYAKRFEDFIRILFSKNYFLAKGKLEEITHPFSLFLFVIQVLSISLFINLFFSLEAEEDSMFFIRILLGVFMFIIIKASLEKIIGSIFSVEGIINKYVYEKLTYRNFLAIILLISNMVFYFSIKPNLTTLLVFTGFIVLFNVTLLFFSYKNYRSIINGNFFYFLLYLCTLEISPYLLLYKAL